MSANTVGLFVDDMDKMVAFYRDVIGMETVWNGGQRAECVRGGLQLVLYSRSHFESMNSQLFDIPTQSKENAEIVFHYPTYGEVDREFERVTKLGAVPVFPPNSLPWGQRASYVADPEANLIEISSGI